MICPVEDELYQIELDNLNDKANNASNIDTTDESSTSATTNESAIIKKNHDTDSSFSWNDESTRYFLSLYQENRKLVSSRKLKTLKAMWIHIANTMTKSGYNVSPLQVENKFKTMERAYKNMVSNNKKTGRGRATCSYESAPQSILHPLQSLAYKKVTDDVAVTNENPIVDEHYLVDDLSCSSNASSSCKTVQKQKTGSTAKLVASCQKTLQDLAADRREETLKKEDFCKDFRDYMKKTLEQREVANNLRERKNVLVEHLIKMFDKKNENLDEK
ncbi:uncharacterized protein LOC114943505 [Nylanderia fulva]|uniref:uncharacterized protein LOC114939886 n=1 Tax=Nylanderia fulva TaxID=613905 RepID=UPI0010FBBD40|nr:uncharacterized protein LOC114939886 [Nylanderia fulva]XP_029174972.1 uncharacterized protein LOC114943505 [Nylanderia fulva]